MKNAFIIHGAYGSPEENWMPWLKKNLESLGYTVYTPFFPNPPLQNLNNWLKVFKEYADKINEETILIGHSLGVSFILRILEKSQKKVKASFLVSGFITSLNNLIFDLVNKTFYEKPFNWKKIKSTSSKFFIFHSDNDPYVPFGKAEELAEKLKSQIILVKGGGHLNTKQGYTKFELLLNKIKKIHK